MHCIVPVMSSKTFRWSVFLGLLSITATAIFVRCRVPSPLAISDSEQTMKMKVMILVENRDWKELRTICGDLEKKFPKSARMDYWIYYQGLALFMEGDFKECKPIFTRLLKEFPNSKMVKSSMYYAAMSDFLSNNYQDTLAACKNFLEKFPDSCSAGDMRYRLSFIDFNDKDVDQSDKIIRELGNFVKNHPDDPANGSMYCLMADTYRKKKIDQKADPAAQTKEKQTNEDAALDAYKKALATDSPDDIIQYAFDSAIAILQKRHDRSGIAEMKEMQRKKKLKSSSPPPGKTEDE